MRRKLSALLLALAMLLPGCAKQTKFADLSDGQAGIIRYAEGRELMAPAASREEAEEIAALYGVELVDYEHGYALFHTEEDPSAVRERGRENGWPELEINSLNPLPETKPEKNRKWK